MKTIMLCRPSLIPHVLADCPERSFSMPTTDLITGSPDCFLVIYVGSEV